MSDQHEILSEVGGEPSTLPGQIGDTIVAVGDGGTDAAFGNAASMYMEGGNTVQGRLKSPVGENQTTIGGGANGAKGTARPAELGGGGGQYSNDHEMSREDYPPQKTQQQYPPNIPNGSNVHETSGGVATHADTGGKADEGRGQNAATAATASTSAQPGGGTKASRRSVRRLSSRSMTGDGDSAAGPAQTTNLASDINGGSIEQVDSGTSSVSCSYLRSHYALLLLAQGGIAADITIGIALTYRRNRSLIFLCSVRIPYPSLLLTLATAPLLIIVAYTYFRTTCIIGLTLHHGNTRRTPTPMMKQPKQQRSSKRIRRSSGASASYSLDDGTSSFQGGGEAHRHRTPSAKAADQPPEEAGAYVMDSEVLALASLDEDSHQKARLRDANTYMDEVLFPITFPWYNSREPLVKTIPRDIDELYAVIYADNDYASIRQDGREGPVPDLFGYGKCEIGQERQQGAIPSFAMGGYDAVASAARRGDDPGKIELTATMPPPPSLEAAIVYHEQRTNANAPKGATVQSTNLQEADQDTIERLKATIEAERAGACSRMPMYCEAIDGGKYFNPPAFLSDDDEPVSANEHSVDPEYSGMYKRDRQLGKRRELAKACARKWKISIKAGGSSTRTRIFRAEEKSGTADESAFRPMLRTAVLPPSVLSGQNVPIAVAEEFDRRESLGSYDVRANAAAVEKAASSNAAKRKIAIGRTRLVWTKKNEKAEGASKYGKFTYTSIITGQKLETNAQKRPREVRVGIRLNGQLLMEPIATSDSSNDAKSPTSSAKKAGRKVKQSDIVADSLSISPMVPASDNRKAGDVKRAVDAVFGENLPKKKNASAKSSVPHAASPSNIIVVEPAAITANVASRIKRAHTTCGSSISRGKGVDSSSSTEASTNGEDTKRPATEDGSHEESMNYVTMKHGATLALKHVAPQYGLLPLDDGLLRAICIAPGMMQGVSVNNMLNAASRERKGNRLCSVCWTGDVADGPGNDMLVQECVDCGLGVHLECCENRGDFVEVAAATSSSGSGQKNTASDHSAQMALRWRCAICVDYLNSSNAPSNDHSEESSIATKKPRRAAKLPSRFTEGETHLAGHSSSWSSRNRPSPSCSLCPHSGGAMSMLGVGMGGGSSAEGDTPAKPVWTHEVCRVWCQPTTNTPSVAVPSNSTADHLRSNSAVVCVLCGTGNCSGADVGIDNLPTGLVKCAAKGCCATFHPMCALLATKMLPRPATTHRSSEDSTPNSPKGARKSRKNPSDTAGAAGKKGGDESFDLEERRVQDIHLCKQYTLTLAEVSHEDGSGSSSTSSTIVPVAFCALHNPKRETELVGCLPGGGVIEEEDGTGATGTGTKKN